MFEIEDGNTVLIQNKISQGRYAVSVSERVGDEKQIEEISLFDNHDKITQVSEKDLNQLLRDVKDIKEMCSDMTDLLETHVKSLDHIEQNIDSTFTNIVSSDQKIHKAIKYKRNGMINVLGVTTGALSGSFFGPIGAVSGALVGLGSTIIYNHVR